MQRKKERKQPPEAGDNTQTPRAKKEPVKAGSFYVAEEKRKQPPEAGDNTQTPRAKKEPVKAGSFYVAEEGEKTAAGGG